MKTILIGTAALLLAGTAQAQLVGGGAHVGAGVSVPNPVPQTTQTVDSLGGDAMRTTTDTARTARDVTRNTANQATETATKNAREADKVASANKPVRVDAGASIRVDRGTRCYYDDYYYDPVYRDGVYYCERSSSGVAAKVSTEPHR